jgi:hypothetical protein
MKKIAQIGSLLLVAACGGGGSDNSGGGGTPDTNTDTTTLFSNYKGKQDLATLQNDNISPYLDALFGNDESLLLVAQTSNKNQKRSSTLLHKQSASREKIDESLECNSGSGRVTGSLDDKSGQGTLTYSYNNCAFGSTVLSGKQIVQYHRWDMVHLTPLDLTTTYKDLQFTAGSTFEKLNGSETVTNLNSCTERSEKNILVTTELPARDRYIDHLTGNMTCVLVDGTETPVISYTGNIYHATYGKVSISTSKPLRYKNLGLEFGNTNKFMDILVAGNFTLSGNNSNVTFSANSIPGAIGQTETAYMTIDFDLNNDSSNERTLTVPAWYMLVDSLRNFSDVDADGLTDGWEKTFGTNPNVADSNDDPDLDGINNRIESLLGTNPHAINLNNTALVLSNYDDIYTTPSVIKARINQPATMPLYLVGFINPLLAKQIKTADLIIDLSDMSDWTYTPSSNCKIENNNQKLRCTINTASFTKQSDICRIQIGSLTYTPTQSGTFPLHYHWETDLPLKAADAVPIEVAEVAKTFVLGTTSQAYTLDHLTDGWGYTFMLSADGNGDPSKITISGEWAVSDDSVQLTRVEYDATNWNCTRSKNKFSCSSITAWMVYNPDFTLHFLKPAKVGKTVMNLTIQTTHGEHINTIHQTRTLAYGIDIQGLAHNLRDAEANGDTEFVVPAGIYVGELINDYGHPLNLRGEPGAEIWLTDGTPQSISAKSIDSLEIHGLSISRIKAETKISNCTIYAKASYPGLLNAPTIENNKILIEGDGDGIINLERPTLIRNNLIIAELPNDMSGQGGLLESAFYQSSYPATLINNTIIGIGMIARDDVMPDSPMTLINNLFMDGSNQISKAPLFGPDQAQVIMEHNLLPTHYSSLSGNNIYSDTPLVNEEYIPQADSPLLDAGNDTADVGSLDLLGHARTSGTHIDIGAVEKQTP